MQSQSLLSGGLVILLLLRLSNVAIFLFLLLLKLLLLLILQRLMIDVVYDPYECYFDVVSIKSTCFYEGNTY